MDVREKAKYIDREALVEWLKRIPLKDLSDGRGLCRVIFEDDFKRAIKKIPKGIIVDVAPVRHGEWEEMHYEGGILDGTNFDRCSVCGYERVFDDPALKTVFKYCPNCGAKMDGGED